MFKLQHNVTEVGTFSTLEEAQAAAEKHDLYDGHPIAWGREYADDNNTLRDDTWVGGWWRIDFVV
jgi:hypothetical protein